MDANVIDTLRFADRLKDAGFEAPKADGLARALAEELGDRVLTRIDHDALGLRIDGLDAKFEALEAKFDAKFEALAAKFDAKFETLRGQVRSPRVQVQWSIRGTRGKVRGIGSQIRRARIQV